MNDVLKRLSSRKFLLALGAFITFIANEQYTEAASAIVGYIVMEGAADTLGSRSSLQVNAETIESQNIDTADTSKIVTGTGKLRTIDDEE